MKVSIFLISLVVGFSTANATQISITDAIYLADYTNDQGKALGAAGTLTVNLSAQVAETLISFSDYESEVVCTELSEPTIPGYPETAECLNSETHWKPVVNLFYLSPFFTAAVGDVRLNLTAPSYARVEDSCIVNLKQLVVVSKVKPSVPSEIVIAETCSAVAHSDNRGLSAKPKALKGGTVEVVVAATLKTTFIRHGQMTLKGTQSLLVQYDEQSLEILPTQVDLSSSLFKHDARLFVK